MRKAYRREPGTLLVWERKSEQIASRPTAASIWAGACRWRRPPTRHCCIMAFRTAKAVRKVAHHRAAARTHPLARGALAAKRTNQLHLSSHRSSYIPALMIVLSVARPRAARPRLRIPTKPACGRWAKPARSCSRIFDRFQPTCWRCYDRLPVFDPPQPAARDHLLATMRT